MTDLRHRLHAARFAYAVGWRKGQVSKLRWEHVDRTNRLMIVPGKLTKTASLRQSPSKGNCGRSSSADGYAREVRRKKRPVFLSPCVFHRGDGKPIGDFRKTWATACTTAKVSGLLFHDLRRSGVRNLIRAGVDRDVAKKISGHKTDSMFSRYDITDERDQRSPS